MIPGKAIPTLVKDADLVREKRRRIVEAAVALFVSKGFHSTTTREIARAAGISVGALYEYIESKDDVLYLVCASIHSEMEAQLLGLLDARGNENGTADANGPRDRRLALGSAETHASRLEAAIAGYFRVCDRMQDSILLIYRETASLGEESRRYVLQNEARITGAFTDLLNAGIDAGEFSLGEHEERAEGMQSMGPRDSERAAALMAHNVMCLGHMWCLRRWFLRGQYSIEEYIRHQTALLMREVAPEACEAE